VTYAEALERLFALQPRGVDFDLERPRRVAQALGSPHEKLPVIHIGGTNGKGSTAAMVEAAARAAGLRTGLYTSPHLLRFTERIRVDGEEIAEDDIARLIERVLDAAGDEPLTFFEIATLAAMVHFVEQKVDVAVLEVGLGGRLDATNIVPAPLCAVVTGVAYDHQEYLGSRLSDIAREKAGIFKPGVPAIAAAPANPDAARFFDDCVLFGRDFDERGLPPLALDGPHQRRNAALAREAIRRSRLPIDDAAIARGFAAVRWPGRLERIGDVIFDCAHNPDAVRTLAAALPTSNYTLVFGALADKDAATMLAELRPRARRVILTKPQSPRAIDTATLAKSGDLVIPDAIAALCATDGPTLVTGSIYLVGHLRGHLLGERRDPLAVRDPLVIRSPR